jgi:hypothetical protein
MYADIIQYEEQTSYRLALANVIQLSRHNTDRKKSYRWVNIIKVDRDHTLEKTTYK